MKITKKFRQETSAFFLGLSAGRIIEVIPVRWSILFLGIATLLWLFDSLSPTNARDYRAIIMCAEVLAEHSGKHWQSVENPRNTKRLWIPIGTVTYGKSSSVVESLYLIFPKPGRYEIGYAFSGMVLAGQKGMSGLNLIRRKFLMEQAGELS